MGESKGRQFEGKRMELYLTDWLVGLAWKAGEGPVRAEAGAAVKTRA
jgi:hypothetical protein